MPNASPHRARTAFPSAGKPATEDQQASKGERRAVQHIAASIRIKIAITLAWLEDEYDDVIDHWIDTHRITQAKRCKAIERRRWARAGSVGRSSQCEIHPHNPYVALRDMVRSRPRS